MTEVAISGIGVWSEQFANWDEFGEALAGRAVDSEPALKPELIPPRERRRAPMAVKMAVEVMDQACRMAAVEPSGVASVFASGMGDMQITDYMCRTLATAPRAVSPTKFHNSVHNASTGYWSIATHSHSPANAVSAYSYSAPAALLEAAIQAVEENIPVVLAVEDLAAPQPFRSVCDIAEPFASALLLMPGGSDMTPLASLQLEVRSATGTDVPLPDALGAGFSGNFAAQMLPLLAAISNQEAVELELPLSKHAMLGVSLRTGDAARSAQA